MTSPYDYTKRNFKDHIVTQSGEVIQQGTPLNATTLGPMDELLDQLKNDVPALVTETTQVALAQLAHEQAAAPHSGHATVSALTTHTGAAAPHTGHETPAGAQAKVDAHANASAPHSGHAPIVHTHSAADIVAGLLDAGRLPAIAITDTFVVSTQAAMLALIAEVGDICVRTDLNKSFILRAAPASTLANWQELLNPTSPVQSVAGKTGAVTLTKADVGLSNVDNESKTTMFTSPAFTGTPTAPTAAQGANTTQVATTAFVLANAANIPRVVRTTNTQLGVSNRGALIDITSGTFTQTFAAAATLGAGWWCFVRNSGDGDITLDPNGTELIDEMTTFVMYPGEFRLIQCDGSSFRSFVLNGFTRVMTATGTFTKPPGYSGFHVKLWGGGGGGGSGNRGGTARAGGAGGGGGSCVDTVLPASAVPNSVTVTIGAGGAGGAARTSDSAGVAGSAGGTTSFGTLLSALGGGGGNGGSTSNNFGGSGGSSGIVGLAAGAFGGGTDSGGTRAGALGGAAGGGCQSSGNGVNTPGANSLYSGAGGGPGGSINSSGVSTAGGKGGDSLAAIGGDVGAGGVVGNPGGAGGVCNYFSGGSGGGGGGSATNGLGGNGGDGGLGGGGGGGGGASIGGNSGAGGKGGDGVVIIMGVV